MVLMEDLVAKFTEASSLQYLAALVSLVWLRGVMRPKRVRGTPNDSTKQMLLWFSVVLVTVCVLYLAFQAEADESSFTVPVTAELKVIAKVIDGDTIKLSDGTRVRLHGIDAPERNQPYGNKATRELTRLLGSSVYVETADIDRYGRTIAVLWTSDGVNVNLEMVCIGAAWWYEKFARRAAKLRECQELARENNQGLWDSDPIAPWKWRRR